MAGNLLAVHVGWDDAGGTITCTVSDGTSYATGAAKVHDGNGQASQVFYLENAGAGSHVITATFSTTTDARRIRAWELSGLLTSGALATAGAGQAQAAPGTGAGAVSSGATASTGATCFVMGFSQDTSELSPGSGTITAGTGYTISGSDVVMAGEWKAGAASGAQTATFTQSVNNDRMTHVVAFKEATSGGTTTTKVLTDTTTIADSLIQWARRVRLQSDAITSFDETVRFLRFKRVMDDGAALVDSFVKNVITAGGTVFTKVLSDTLAMTDGTVQWLRRVRNAIDSIAITEDGVLRTFIITASEAIDVNDGFVATRRFKRVMDEGLTLIDTFSKTLVGANIVYAKVLSDSVTVIDDAGQRWKLRVRQLTDGCGLSDQVIQCLRRVRVLGDVVEFIDGVVTVRRSVRSMDEGVVVSDESVVTRVFYQLSDTSFSFGSSGPPFRFGGM